VYQRFAFVKAVLESETLRDGLHIIERRPHLEHIAVSRRVDPAHSARAGPILSRELTAHGPRQPVSRSISGLRSVPRQITELSNETTYDTVPNRFVKYVLTRWRDIAVDIQRSLAGVTSSEKRGRREASTVIGEVSRYLSAPALKEAGQLEGFPQSNPVLQSRSGYRDVLEAFLLVEAAATINWEARDRLFWAGQRNVAELYEYWVFLELVRIVEGLDGFTVDKRDLVRRTTNGLSLELRRTGAAVVRAVGRRRGTPVEVRVWFNKTFPHSDHGRDSSWTVPMRPDCSIEIVPQQRVLAADTWIHFDAKYRIQEISDAFEDDTAKEDAPRGAIGDEPVPADLGKMHAYHDAIRRTAGAYVLYPGRDGGTEVRRAEYDEILPGLGAFALRPVEDGDASAASRRALTAFLDDVIDHVASQGTAAERARFWTSKSYSALYQNRVDFSAVLDKPPEDTTVLLGYVRSSEHLAWILATGMYNIRADPERPGAIGVEAPELDPDFVLLYDEDGLNATLMVASREVTIQTAAALLATGYPDPRGSRYFCLGVEYLREVPDPAGESVRELVRLRVPTAPWGKPLLLPWARIPALAKPSSVIS
jgi:hypothetical protein